MSKQSPEFQRAWSAYWRAVAASESREAIAPLWQAVMKALHGTPDPPAGFYKATTTATPDCTFTISADSVVGKASPVYGLAAWLATNSPPIDRLDVSPIDDWHDAMVRDAKRN